MFRGDFMKYAAAYAPYLALLLLAQFAAEVTMHSYMQLLLICIPCLLLYIGCSIAVPFYAYSLVKKSYAQNEQLPIVSFTIFLFVFASLIISLVQYVFYTYISPDYIDTLYQNLLENIQITAKVYPDIAANFQQIADTIVLPTPLQLATNSIANNGFVGAIFGLIYLLIIRFKQKKNNTQSWIYQ